MGMEIEEGLRRWFGHESFRSGQREAVEAVLDGHDAVVVMPTGSGKSLCYQLAAMLLPGTTLVISPLIALMKDQVDGLTRRGCPTTIDTDQFGKDIGIMNGIAVDTILNVLQSQGVLTRTTMRRGGRLTSVQLNSDVDTSGLEKVFETRREDLSFSVTHPKDWNQPSRGDVRCLKSN